MVGSVQVAPEAVKIGMAVKLEFVPSGDGPPVPMFAPG